MSERPVTSSTGEKLSREDIACNFGDLHEPLDAGQANTEADRCLYCFDAPCVRACPTSIDIPTFIHQIKSGNSKGAARTILDANIMGGTCARVCPTEVLCEEACVRNTADDKPVEIGALQRFAVDHLLSEEDEHPFERAADTGKHIAVVGAGPAGLACAHRLARFGHRVTIFEANMKPGGLNEYGLAAYKMVDDFAAREVDFILDVGGIKIEYGKALGEDVSLARLQNEYDAVFLGVGLADTNRVSIPGDTLDGVMDAIDFIAELRQACHPADVKVPDEIVVIGGGNTAIDAAVQAKRLGAENVTMVYRRGPQQMSATAWEQDLAATNGVNIKYWASPKAFLGSKVVEGVAFARTFVGEDGRLTEKEKAMAIDAELVLLAIGQVLDQPNGLPDVERGKFSVGDDYQTSLPGVFAGGDCVRTGEDLTVQAVEDGKQAAVAIDHYFKSA